MRKAGSFEEEECRAIRRQKSAKRTTGRTGRPGIWCAACMAARCVASPHSANPSTARPYPTIAMDYCYPGAAPADVDAMAARAKARYEKGFPAE